MRIWRKRNLAHCWWKRKLVQPYGQRDGGNPTSGYAPEEIKSLAQGCVCSPTFTAALFTVGDTGEQPKCLSVNGRVKKMWPSHTTEYYLALKKETLSLTWRI